MAVKKNTSAPKKSKTRTTTQAKRPLPASQEKFPIVGIGASAGGLEALEVFFSAMPPDSNMAFVLVTHLDPTHTSILPELIQKKTKMKVKQITDNMHIKPNRVYIIPPNKELAILNSTLQLMEMSRSRGHNLPIDSFFRSLAQDQSSRAIGIILSGTGTDGTLGIRAIKGETGLVMVQTSDSAKYDGMPKSVIETGLADFVLEPSKMPEQLILYAKQATSRLGIETKHPKDLTENGLQKIYILLRSHKKHDFSQYKKNTICRRIERRMHIHQISDIADYVHFLQVSESEVTVLFKELLINVTNFFRDPDAFAVLKNKYIPDLLKDKPVDYSVRVWVPGCSSGEEPYSIAILLLECMAAMNRHFSIQIFGTDIDEDAIALARGGKYPDSISADVSPERLNKFFTKEENHYRINKTVRDLVVFASQNIIKDPPFTKLDLISCRNLLIYFGPELQKKLLPLFHYSLKKEALLFLGSSETIGPNTDLFTTLDKKWKIFRPKSAHNVVYPRMAFTVPHPAAELSMQETDRFHGKHEDVDTQKLLKAMLSQSDLPPCVIIDDRAEIIFIHGKTGYFLEPAEGETSTNILEMARPGLRSGLKMALDKIAIEREEVLLKDLKIKNNGSSVTVNLTVRPLSIMQTGRRGLIIVIFNEIDYQEGKKKAQTERVKRLTKDAEKVRLEDELQYTRESLQATIEELETANEELKSTNEELQSTNEELQSTNEEMETSKEELQSLNEEAGTVNSELQRRIEELSRSNDDIKNFLDSTKIAIIFLDIDLCVRLFTPSVTSFIPLIASDIGRPIKHFAHTLPGVKLDQYAKGVLLDLAVQEIDVKDASGNYYRMRVRPYRTLNNVIDGVVITFDDITALIHLNREKRLAAIVRDSNDAITLLDLEGNIKAWNHGAEIIYGYTETEALKMNIFDIVPQEQKDETQALITGPDKDAGMVPFVAKRQRKDGKTVRVWCRSTWLFDKDGKTTYVAITDRDLNLLTEDAIRYLTGEDHAK